MKYRVVIVVAFAAICSLAANSSSGAPLTVQQISSDSLDAVSDFNRATPTSGGRILYADTPDSTVWFYPGSGAPISVQTLPAPGEVVANHVFMLGSGATASTVIGGWRRGTGYGNVTINGGAPAKVTLNPESVSVRDGCVFMVLQTPTAGQHVFKVDPLDGTTVQISNGVVTRGALRVDSSQCRAVWSWTPTDTDPISLQYWNGTTTTTLDTDLASGIDFYGGKIVYAKTVSGIRQVFAIDTLGSLTPVQVSAETDATKYQTSPQTDGRHVAWYRNNIDGTSPQLMLSGGLVFPTGPLTKIHNVEYAFQLDRGQLLWKRPSGSFAYDDGMETTEIDPAPATTIVNPWLTDGYIAFIGLSPAGGTDTEVFRITATPPTDSTAPLLVTATPGTGEVTVRWDSVLGATSYNLYMAQEPGVTKDNYTSLVGGRKISGVTSPFSVTNLAANTAYYFAVTTVDGGTEGPSSRVAGTILVGNLTWQPVGGLGATTFFSVAADGANASFVYAGANGSVYKSSDGGLNWTQVLSSGTTLANRVAALAVSGGRVLANTMDEADIWQGLNNGTNWTRILEVTGFGELNGSLAVDPTNANTIYAGDFILPTRVAGESMVIKSVTGGSTWTHTAEASVPGAEIHAYALAIDPSTPTTVYAGGSGTPNIAKTTNGGTSWLGSAIAGNTGGVYSLAIDPRNTSIVYASTRDQGVYKSLAGGSGWTAINSGLAGVGVTGTGFNSILVDLQHSNYLHLGAGNGYWYSINGGESWVAANTGLGSAYIYALAMTPSRRLIAATSTGLYLLSVAPQPTVASVSPGSGNVSGGTSVTITGTSFQTGATVTFGGTAATNVAVVNPTTITATTPAHLAGAVDVVVTNIDGQSGTLAGGFTYSNAPNPPTGVAATAQTTLSVLVTWNSAASATSYQVFRRSPGGGYVQINNPTGTSYTDTVSANTSYAYRVRAVNASGVSGDSAADVATTMLFTDDPLIAGTVIKAIHLSQLRTAVNYVRQLAGSGPMIFTDSASAGVTVKVIHLTEMRSALDTALGTLTIGTTPYTDTSPSGVVIKAIHFQEIRNRLQ